MKKVFLSILVLGSATLMSQVLNAGDLRPPPPKCVWPYHLVPGPGGKLICVRAIHN